MKRSCLRLALLSASAMLAAWVSLPRAAAQRTDDSSAQPAAEQASDKQASGKQAPGKQASPVERQSKNAARKRQTVTPAQEAAVLALVREHHPEVESLLQQLKRAGKPQYVPAVRALFRTSVRLAAIQERDTQRYELELRRWKLESRTQLLALKICRAAGEQQASLTSELEDAVRKLQQTRIALTELDRDRKQQELAELEQRIAELSRDPEGQAEADVEALLRSARRLTGKRKRPPKSSAAPSGSPEAPKRNNKAPRKGAT